MDGWDQPPRSREASCLRDCDVSLLIAGSAEFESSHRQLLFAALR